MPIVSPQADIIAVDSVPALLSLLDDLTSLPVDPPSLYLGLEGIRVVRHGSISIISIYIALRGRDPVQDALSVD
jgi:hypothetical protein